MGLLYLFNLILLLRYRLTVVLLLTGTTIERVCDKIRVDIRQFVLQLARHWTAHYVLQLVSDSDHDAVLELFVLSTVLSCRDSLFRATNRAGRSGDLISVGRNVRHLF
jgi:hypothetical protein